MFLHNLTVSFRNLWKYKTQTIISIVGLAVGFTCFSLATLWMRYENTYDSFHKNVKNLYLLTLPDSFHDSGRTLGAGDFVISNIKENFPEVKDAASIVPRKNLSYTIGEQTEGLDDILVDAAFLKMFDIKVLEGSLDFTDNTVVDNNGFPTANNQKVAITKEKAQLLFGKESPIGQTLTFYNEEYTIAAIVSGYSKHSNFPFDILMPIPNYYKGYGVLELLPNVDVDAFKQKLYEHKIVKHGNQWTSAEWTNTELVALTDLRTEDPTMLREIKFQHIKLFAWSGILVILCSLFNYLTLFISRFKIRSKELALRVVCGASLWSLFSLLLVEFLTTLLAAMLLGLIIMELVASEFQRLSEIQMNVGSVYVELSLYILAIILLTVLLFAITLVVFRKYALNTTIRRTNNQMFRRISIIAQLVISIGFVFCTTVMIKQVSYLHNTSDIGFEYKNRSYLRVYDKSADMISDKMKQIPEITEVVTGCLPLMPPAILSGQTYSEWDGKTTKDESIFVQQVFISKAFVDFYELQLIAGEMLIDGELPQNVLINESALKAFGWNKDEAVGKSFGYGKHTVKGVFKNIYNGLPTVESSPCCYSYEKIGNSSILFKYTNRKIAEAKIIEMIKKDFPDLPNHIFGIHDTEEIYESFFKSEKALILMLNIMSAICVLISVFGFFSLVSLSCEERRKEIAIRKVNGADIHDIIAIFFKEYALLLAIGAAIAFPIGYYIMKGWLEQYINQTSIDAWVYAAILLAFAFVIILCVGWRIYKTSRENPADVVKSE